MLCSIFCFLAISRQTKVPQQPSMLDASVAIHVVNEPVDTAAQVGTTSRLAVIPTSVPRAHKERPQRLVVMKWESLTPTIAQVKEVSTGVVDFNRPGRAVFLITLIDINGDSLPSTRIGTIEVEPKAIRVWKLDTTPTEPADVENVSVQLGHQETFRFKAVIHGGGPVTRRIEFKVLDPTVAMVSILGDDPGQTATVMPSQELRIQGLKQGVTKLEAYCGGEITYFNLDAFTPSVAIKGDTTAEQDDLKTYTISRSAGKDGRGKPSGGDLTVDGGRVETRDGDTYQVRFLKTGDVKLSFAAESDKTIKTSLDVTVAPVCQSISITKMPARVVDGDKVSIGLDLRDKQDVPIDADLRPKLSVKLTPLVQTQQPADDPTFVSLVHETGPDGKPADSLVVDRARPGFYDVDITDGKNSVSSRIEILAPLEVTAMLDNSPSARDYFGREVFHEYHIFRILAKNNLKFAEHTDRFGGTNINLLGNTLSLPAIVYKPGSEGTGGAAGRESIIGGGETPGLDITLSSPQAIAQFADNPTGRLIVNIPPVLLNQFNAIKPAIDFRDPVAVGQRLLHSFIATATYVSQGYKGTNFAERQLRLGGDTIARMNGVETLSDTLVKYLDSEKNHQVVGSSDILSEKVAVAPGDPKIYYVLVSKKAFTNIYTITGLKVVLFPQTPVVVDYTVETEQRTTATPAPGAVPPAGAPPAGGGNGGH